MDPNLNAAGLAFLGSSLLFFLMSNVVTGQPTPADWSPARHGRRDARPTRQNSDGDTFETEGPGYWLLYLLPRIATQTVDRRAPTRRPPDTAANARSSSRQVREITARVMAILSHVLIVSGLVVVGARHFDNLTAGIAAATLYLLLPYTALWTGSVEHALPGALLDVGHRVLPPAARGGMLIGLASGTIYYPIFLLPLWCSYYWERGVKRFLTGVADRRSACWCSRSRSPPAASTASATT